MKILKLIILVVTISITIASCSGGKGSHRCQTCPKFSQVKSTTNNFAS